MLEPSEILLYFFTTCSLVTTSLPHFLQFTIAYWMHVFCTFILSSGVSFDCLLHATSSCVSNVLVYSQISPNVQSPYGHGPQKYNTVAQSEAHSENSQSTRSLFT